MITKKIMYVTSNGIACESRPDAEEKEFKYLLQKMFPDHVSPFGEIELGILWDSFITIASVREDILKVGAENE